MNRILTLILTGLLLVPFISRGQSNVKDSSLMIPMLHVSYAYMLPGADMADRFGGNSSIGGGVNLKFKKNWLIGADFNYLFGNKVKGADSLFSSIETEDGFIINRDGELDAPLVFERGYYISLRFGKLFPIWSPNKNSGPFVMASAGYFQHKIRIENANNTIPQVTGDYKKGYDKLSSGIGISEFIGYMYFGNSRFVSFYGGFEFTQAFTRSRRTYDFNLRGYDATKRLDVLYAVKIGWIIPFYKKVPTGYYYD